MAESKKFKKKVKKVMHEFKEHKLHEGSKKGPKVTNPKQALAIALSEADKLKGKSDDLKEKKMENNPDKLNMRLPKKEVIIEIERHKSRTSPAQKAMKKCSKCGSRKKKEY